MSLYLENDKDRARVTIRIRHPRCAAIELLIPLDNKNQKVDEAVTKLYAITHHGGCCGWTSETCLECSVHQIITVVRRCIDDPRSSRAQVAVSAEYQDGTRRSLGSIDEGNGAAAKLIDKINRYVSHVDQKLIAANAAAGRVL